jgi:hypothetical protein
VRAAKLRSCGGAGVLCLLLASPAAAQTQSPARAPKFEVDVGAAFIGSGTFGSANANLTSPSGSLTLFSTANDLTASIGPEAHVVFGLSRRLQAELSGTWSRAELQSRISGDAEGAEAATSTLGISLYTVETSIVWYPRRHRKLDPFVRGGAGWLREVTNDGTLSADGVIASGAAGVKYWLREDNRRTLKRFGLRAEVRVVSRSGGLSLDLAKRLIAPALGVSAILGF